MKFIGLRTLKSSIGVVVAIYVATFLHLDFPISAGLIAILSILDTKRQTWIVAGKRALSVVVGLTLAAIVFSIFGFRIYTIGLFLLIFIPLSNVLNLREGTMTNVVLVTHILSFNEISFAVFSNEIMLMMIGITMGLLLNIHMPNNEEKVRSSQLEIEERMRVVLQVYAFELINSCNLSVEDDSLVQLRQAIREGKAHAYQFLNNHFFMENSYYVEYMSMRKRQYERLKAMARHISGIILTQEVARDVSTFTELVSRDISECNGGSVLVEELQLLLSKYRRSELPTTRQEFEDRARLFLFINELETLIQIKVDFMDEHGDLKYCEV